MAISKSTTKKSPSSHRIKRKTVNFRFKKESIDGMDQLLKLYHQAGHFKISRTDILESLIFYAKRLSPKSLSKIFVAYWEEYKK